ncbi:tandem-95 repeat protein [Pseudoalteromonas sp. SR43-6]|uniref:Ig-like domain-containing protein n=1 Tax=unclassified Pseudoalteromonas TaxID=194690 RepID=UPI0015FA6008|nr:MULTISPECIES: Ig-like domain-containing protein [unclassified Pseudoalteromonas]MBB1290143.1 tandem-95 repeat protein [Pseudoalteromonas sp. SR41-5]MBB1373792.1 tandem-95 repeat protein [Pseudoalteromonas sp. SR43-6]MBB1412843.1 tandem-95 repeat protein [Pseudoalteromonas sp. SG43-8]
MTAKNIFLLGSMVFLLSACGGSEESPTQEAIQSPTAEVIPPTVTSYINLAGVIASNQTKSTKVLGAVTSSRGVVGASLANTRANIVFSQTNDTVQGNVSFLLEASDTDGIAEVNLVLPSVYKSISLCSSDCGVDYEKSIIGLSPALYGATPGEIRLEIWITDTLNNQALADAITFNWQPYQIEGVTAQRDEDNINLSWQANPELNRYNVYIATQAGVSSTNINELENGQQFLSIQDTALSITESLTDKSYQVLITGVDGSGESGFANIINIAPVGGELAFAPEANVDQFQINEDQTLQGNVLTNDTNQYSGDLRVNADALILPQHGTLNINENGDFTYIPIANFNGEDAFSYQVANELGMTDTAVVEITILAVNDAPIALDNTYSVTNNGTLVVLSPGLLINDSDIDLDDLTVDTTPVSEPTRGQLTLFDNGGFEYQGEQNMQGQDSFQYRVVDAQGAQAIANVTIVSSNTNVAPVTKNDSYSLSEDETLVVTAANGVLSNDTDPNNDSFSVDETFMVAPTHGQLLLATDGSFSYVPDANFNGVDQFQYQAIDSLGATSSATVTLVINSEPDNPVAQNDAYQFSKNKLFEVTVQNGLLINDFNIEAGDLSVNTTAINTTQNGELTLNADGSFIYQPDLGFIGVDSFTYSISNEQGLTATAQVTLSESGVNTFPQANDDRYTLDEDSSASLLDVLANDTDADGDTITISNIENTAGEATIVAGKIQFTPPANFSGEIVLTYTITDGYSTGNEGINDRTASVTITVTPVNDAPTANADSATMNEDAPALLVNVLANDSDIDGDTLVITAATADRGSASVVDNKIQYTPAANTNGTAIINYTISDGNGGTATTNLTITIIPVNDAPIANADSATIDEDAAPILINVLANDSDVDGDSLTISAASANIGSVSVVGNQIQYTPAADDNGLATVTYTVSDSNGGASTATLTITIKPVNDAPIANADTATMDEDAAPILINVLANDSDEDGDSLAISTASADIGSASVVGNQIQYTPAANTNGLATVTYTVSDNNGGTNTATVAVTITAVNDAPVANNDTATMAEDAAPILINVLANDSDEDGDSLVISAASADVGSASVVGNQIQYTPAANTNGLATVTYTVSDNNGGTNTATVAITITEVNDAPVASVQSFSISENATDGDIIGTVSASDIENQTLTYSLTGGDTASFEINSSSGVLSTVGESPFDFETTNQYILNVTITDDGTPNESSNVNITVNITDEVELLIPTEDVTFGRPITGELDLSYIFSGGEFKDSIELNGNLYFVGFTNNADKDLLIVSYSNNGDINTAFNNTGTKILDLDQDEEATAIISDGTDLFIAYSSFDGTHNEACMLKMDLAGTLNTGSDDDDDDDGESGAGIQCTTLNSTTVINDLEIDDNKILAVGKHFDGTQNDSLWIHYKKSDLDFENSTPAIVDVSGANRDDEGFAIKNFDKSDYLVVGTVTSAEGTKDSLIRYLKSDGDNDNNFNGGSALIIDISDNNKDDELFAVGGVVDSEFTAFAGGYITRNSGEKEAVVLAIDKTGTLITSFGDAGTAIYDIDGNGGNGNGGAKITGIKHESSNNGISLSGTTGVSASEKLFSARINIEGTLDDAYGTSGINIIDGISGKQFANSLAIDPNDTIWVAGVNDDSSTKPFIAAIDSQATLFSNFETNGYSTFNNLVDATNDESMHVLQLSNGPNVGKYILASTAKSDSVTKLVLTRFTSAGDIDTSFSESGHKEIAIDLSKSRVALTEQSDGNLVITGSKNSENGEAGFVAKVDQSGNLDSSFATDGVYTTSVSGAELVNLTDIALDNSGNIITAGSIVTSGTPSPIVIMLTPEGTLEPNFGTGGSIIGSAFEYYNRVHTDNADIFIGGKSVLSGTSKLIALKLSSNGTETFKYVGEETTDTDNKIVQILTDTTGKLYLIANLIDSPNKANVIRLLVTGTLDTSFAVNGVGEYTLASTGNTELSGAALDSSDQLILAGKANNKGMLARILTDGTLDNTFGANGAGFYEASQCVSTHVFTSIILQNDTQVVVSSTCNDTNSNNVSISKFNFEADGA